MHERVALLVGPLMHPGAHIPAHSAADGLPQQSAAGSVEGVGLQVCVDAPHEGIILSPVQDVLSILACQKMLGDFNSFTAFLLRRTKESSHKAYHVFQVQMR